MKRFVAPLFDALKQHASADPVSLHVPGHRNGHAMTPPDTNDVEADVNQVQAYYSQIMKLDVTELSSTDDLHHPEASIQQAQQLAAACFGAEETFFLVGGSTSGNIALLLAVCSPGDLILVQRNVHKSVLNGLKLAGAAAVFITPQYEAESDLAIAPSLKDIGQAIEAYPEAKAVFLTNPNYYGVGIDLRPYAEAIHRHHKLLIVDEAHGAHYGLHPKLPYSALKAGADAVVQSTHKTLLSLTMGAMLHVQGERLNRHALRQALSMIQSSSPSFPIMASLDISRAMIDYYGMQLFEQALHEAASFRQWINRNGSPVNALELPAVSSADYMDPLRIVLFDCSGTMTGYELQRELEQYGCWAEMADPRYVVLIFGIHISNHHVERLKAAIDGIGKKTRTNESIGMTAYERITALRSNETAESFSKPVLFDRGRLMYRQTVRIPLSDSEGRAAAEMVIPYPPGIPILYPGENISSSLIRYIGRLAEAGAKFQGADDAAMRTIEVYE